MTRQLMKKIALSIFLLGIMTTFLKGQNRINSYEYWFDSNYSAHINVSVSPSPVLQLNTSINTTALNMGVHTFNIRFLDDSGHYSSVISDFFVSSGASNNLSHYQYWFDNEYSLAITQAINPQTQLSLNSSIDASSLNNGMHQLHIRFKEAGGIWSSVVSSFFQKSGNGNSSVNLITAYKYWLDSISAPVTMVQLQVPVNPYQLINNLDMTNVVKGSHVLNIQFRDTSGLWSSVLSESFVKNPLPIASFSALNPSICLGDSITFSNLSFDADSFLWNFGDGTISSDFEPVHIYNQPGTYAVSLTASDSASGIDSTLVLSAYISVWGEASAQFNYSAVLGDVSFNNTSANGSNYFWDFGDGSSGSSLQNPTHSYSANGAYTVMLIASNICDADTIYQSILIEGLGIENNPGIEYVKIFPNPLVDECTIRFSLNQRSDVKIKVYDLIGNEVSNILDASLAPNRHEIVWKEGAELGAGIYMLKISIGTNQQSFKLIKNN